jgi:hypothetical protein
VEPENSANGRSPNEKAVLPVQAQPLQLDKIENSHVQTILLPQLKAQELEQQIKSTEHKERGGLCNVWQKT